MDREHRAEQIKIGHWINIFRQIPSENSKVYQYRAHSAGVLRIEYIRQKKKKKEKKGERRGGGLYAVFLSKCTHDKTAKREVSVAMEKATRD